MVGDRRLQVIVKGKLTCTLCGVPKDLSEFVKSSRTKSGRISHCRPCESTRTRTIFLVGDGRYKKYGITKNEFDLMVVRQNGLCAICGGGPIKKARLGVDHSHSTGQVRGLLCDNCNQGLGKFKEDIYLLDKAIEYLRSNIT